MTDITGYVNPDGTQEGNHMTTRLRSFTPTDEYRAFRVTVRDEYGMTFTVNVPQALGVHDALNLAKDKVWREEQTDVTPLEAAEYHETCGFLWRLHDNRVAGRRLPFGCPDETVAREEWGR